jgi:putative peptidoglycan lipid II flippase
MAAHASDGGAPRASAGARLAGAAALIAALTVVSRLAGFGRILVFTWAVGVDDLGDLYQTANTIPNIIFEIVAGGALASLVVPVIAGPLARGDTARVAESVSALLTWVVTLLTPVALGVALLAEPIVRLLDRDASPAAVGVGADMLRIFAPQLPLYGIGIVLTGVLQAHRRFAWPVLAPLLSSVTAAATYLTFAAVAGRGVGIEGVSRDGLLILAVGTTIAVAVLSLCLLVPVRSLGLRLRPAYRLGAVGGSVRRLAAAGAVTVGAQQASLALAIVLANGGPAGSLVLYTLAQTVYLLPWAVLALPIASSAFPALAEAHVTAAEDRFRAVSAAALRGLLLITGLGVGALVALAPDAAIILAATAAGDPDPGALAAGIAAFAPGLFGYGLLALLSRVLYARQEVRAAAGTTALGWAVVAAASLLLTAVSPPAQRVAVLAAANSIGMLVLGTALVVAVARRAGTAALAGAGRAAVVAMAAGAAGAAAAAALRTVVGTSPPTVGAALVRGVLCAVVLAVVFVAVAYGGDRRDVRPALAALAYRVGRRPPAGDQPAQRAEPAQRIEPAEPAGEAHR